MIRARLAAPIVLVAAAGTLAPARAATDQDPWLGHDKLLHFEVSAAIAAGGYGGAALFSPRTEVRLATGAGLALAAGVGKELWDLQGNGDASWRDLTWDVIGTATGLAVAVTIDWLIGRITR